MFNRTMHRVLCGTIVLVSGLLLASCEGYFSYTVVNNTDQDLLTWTGDRSCHASIGKRQEYGPTDTVAADEAYDYRGNVGGTGAYPRCVYVATTDRRLVATEPFRNGGVLTINMPLTLGARFPDRNELPKQSYWEETRDQMTETPGAWVMTGFGLLLLAAIVVGLGASLIDFARRVRRKTA